jgi:hypothetical protein
MPGTSDPRLLHKTNTAILRIVDGERVIQRHERVAIKRREVARRVIVR